MICKDTIKKRKAIYGNNFPQIAKIQNIQNAFKFYVSINDKNFIIRFILKFFYKLFCKDLTPSDIAKNLSILKSVRINFIKNKLHELENSSSYDSYVTQIEIKSLNEALEDSIKDYENYLWIANNYEEYEQL